MSPFTKAAALASVLSSEFWYMHLYSQDEDFDKSHALTQQYYEELSEEADTLMELAIQEGFDVINPNAAATELQLSIEQQKSYSYFDIVSIAKSKLSTYLDVLRELRGSTDKTDIQSLLDSLLEHWDKEVNYRLARRTSTPSLLNGFVNSGLDNALAYLMRAR